MHPRAPLLLLALAGCAPRLAGEREPPREVIRIGAARVELRSLPEDAGAARQVARALALALPPTSRWGELEVPVTITVHPTHEALEVAARRPGSDWLRAWARYDSIELQSPATWGPLGASDAEVVELLTHELTHCVMYQRAADGWSWAEKGIPLWFREGMASVTAGQGARRSSLEEVRRLYEEGRPAGPDPLSEPEPLRPGQAKVIYGAAHHAFGFLLARHGEGRVLELLERMRGGAGFARAFEASLGQDEAGFRADFRRYLLERGWQRPGER